MSNRALPRTFTALLILGAVYAAPMRAAAADLLIHNVSLISPERVEPMPHADVLLKNGKISKELGSIEVGKRADLLLLNRNPLENISAYDSIEMIILNGNPIAREALR